MRERAGEIAVSAAEEDTAAQQLSSAVPAQTGRTFTQVDASASITHELTLEMNSSILPDSLSFTLITICIFREGKLILPHHT